MADFKTHITTSTAIGVVYGAAGHLHWELPGSTCIVAGGLCGFAGMLPDMDSDSGHARREIIAFAAVGTPMLMISRFAQMGLSHEQMVIAAGCVYLIVRFGLGEILRRYTVHRGMFHSLPGAVIAGLITMLLCSGQTIELRLFKVAAVLLGYVVHLLLDELWAIEWRITGVRFKNSFGTAFKMFGPKWFPNVVTYSLLVLVGTMVHKDAELTEYLTLPEHRLEQFARDAWPGDGTDDRMQR